VSAITEHKSLH